MKIWYAPHVMVMARQHTSMSANASNAKGEVISPELLKRLNKNILIALPAMD
jgi:hypothetical protein